MRTLSITYVSATLLWVATTSNFMRDAFGEDWPRFRGLNGTGISVSTGLPTKFGPDNNILWKLKVGRGSSSPIVSGGRLFFTTYDGEKRSLHCLDAESGEILWSQSVRKERDENATEPNGPATSTPVTDGKSVFVFFPDVGILAYTWSGKQKWRTQVEPFYSFHGIASSLILADKKIVLLADQLKGSYLAAYDANTGLMAWESKRLNGLTGGYSTPTAYTPTGGRTQIVVSGPGELVSYDAATGERAWWVGGITNAPVSLPVVSEDSVFVCEPVGEPVSVSDVTETAAQFDKNGDGQITLSEVGSDVAMRRLFKRIDKTSGNNDGILQTSEVTKAFGGFVGRGGLVAVGLDGEGDVTQTHIRWTYRKSVPQVASVLLYNDVLYLVKDGGVLTTLSPKTGDVFKRGRLKNGGRKYFASPVAGDGKVFLLDTDGQMTVVKAGHKWKVLAINRLGEPCFATPAISSGRIYVRTAESLFCFGSE